MVLSYNGEKNALTRPPVPGSGSTQSLHYSRVPALSVTPYNTAAKPCCLAHHSLRYHTGGMDCFQPEALPLLASIHSAGNTTNLTQLQTLGPTTATCLQDTLMQQGHKCYGVTKHLLINRLKVHSMKWNSHLTLLMKPRT